MHETPNHGLLACLSFQDLKDNVCTMLLTYIYWIVNLDRLLIGRYITLDMNIHQFYFPNITLII